MSNWFLHSLTKALKIYDPELFAGQTKDGVPCVFRRTKRWEPAYEGEDFTLRTLVEGKQLVFALTDTWTVMGTPRFWGFDTVLGRVQKLDAWANKNFFEELDAENDKVDERSRRALKNEMEAFWSDERERFKKATGDILTHSMSKDNKRQKNLDRSIKNGNS